MALSRLHKVPDLFRQPIGKRRITDPFFKRFMPTDMVGFLFPTFPRDKLRGTLGMRLPMK